ncbi:dispanin subfamily A member 2b-like [Carcharodon carcharias]|uniref:dispanin subfamily A member 2b-like n=1 Tax=Carcharodon carcharias TaxID=13397 RepID=UPI001B7E5FA2|nr:dispanin subfamily A member 2b-like [Carcharodon carcharias]
MAKTVSSDSESTVAGSVRDYLVWSIFNLSYMNFGCLGLVALIFSIKSRDRKIVEDLEGARYFAAKARTFNIAAAVLSAIVFIIFIALLAAGMFKVAKTVQLQQKYKLFGKG